MSAIVLIAIFVVGLAIFDLVAGNYGVDSRPTIGDDHARPLFPTHHS